MEKVLAVSNGHNLNDQIGNKRKLCCQIDFVVIFVSLNIQQITTNNLYNIILNSVNFLKFELQQENVKLCLLQSTLCCYITIVRYWQSHHFRFKSSFDYLQCQCGCRNAFKGFEMSVFGKGFFSDQVDMEEFKQCLECDVCIWKNSACQFKCNFATQLLWKLFDESVCRFQGHGPNCNPTCAKVLDQCKTSVNQ
eukprot:TRINITY_DN2944_c0_g1_i11.p3 TRINITY_DN2944_c0_g1~~TRINITY_DN2944_c0_g1_i11.p3  ORF type:complete len:194 (-),score=-3.95 TRINITY_DN2944_c0_g1_i11:256-837(-)